MTRFAVTTVACALWLAGCADDVLDRLPPRTSTQPKARTAPRTSPRKAQPPLPRTPCPPALAGCRSAAGRIVYVEAVDPDGDGDAHFVLASRESITSPGITVVDVRRDLRPDPLPVVGDRLSAAGPVHTGSYGQRQIEAVAIDVGGQRRRR